MRRKKNIAKVLLLGEASLQTHHVYSTLERRGNDRFHVVSTWNPHGVFVGLQVTSSLILIFTSTRIFFAHLFAGITAKCSNYLRHFSSTLKGELDW